MSDKPKGIVNPWREATPLRTPPVRPSTSKKDAPSIDMFEESYQHPGRYVMRSAHASILVTHEIVDTPAAALDVLVRCVNELRLVSSVMTSALVRAGVGIRISNETWNVPDDAKHAARLENERATIWFASSTVDGGMLALARALRLSEAAKTTKKWGITPMLK